MRANCLKNKCLYVFGEYTLDPDRGSLRSAAERIDLPPKVFETLYVLVAHRGELVSKTEIMSAVWPESFVEESSLTQNIFQLRRLLGKTADGREYIETLSRRGYRLAVPVEEREVVASQRPEVPASPLPSPQVPVGLEKSKPDSPRRGGRMAAVALSAIVLLLGADAAVQAIRHGKDQPAIGEFKRLTDDGFYKDMYTPLLTDGPRVYFTETDANKNYLAEVSAGGGETTRHELPSKASFALSFSQQRSEILVGTLRERNKERPLSVLSLPSRAMAPVADLMAHAASWSPDGARIAYAFGSKLIIAKANGQDSHEIANMAGVPFSPRWSPDGTRLRFSLYGFYPQPTLWEVKEDGTGLHSLFRGESVEFSAATGDWSPDGRYFVFSVDSVSKSTLWIARDHAYWWQSSHASMLAEGPVDSWLSPVFSPDGTHIYALGWQERGHLLKFDPASHQFHPFLKDLSTDTFSFSPDGQWIAYTAYPEGTLWRSRLDGSDRVKIAGGESGVARFPQWSHDGRQISYIVSEGIKWKIYTVPAEGGKSVMMVPDGSNQGVATWSPDGTRLAYGQIVDFGVGQQTSVNIRILDIKKGTPTIIPGSDDLWTARWSPDGRYIAAVGSKDERLMLYDFTTGRWTIAADKGTNDVVWNKDGSALYFDSTREPAIFKFTPKTGSVTKYADLTGIRRTGFFGWGLNAAPDGEPVLVQDAGVQEVYSLQVKLP